MTRRIAVALLVTLVAALLGSTVAAGPHVVFRFETESSRATARECAAIWTAEGPALAASLLTDAAASDTDTIVCLILDTDGFQHHFARNLPDWGVGVALPNGRLVALDHVRLPAVGRGVREVFLHEMVHALLFQASRGVWLPTWLHEGAAMQHSGEWRFIDTVSLIFEGRVPSLDRLQGRFPASAARADRAYRVSLLAVQRLQQQYGAGVVRDLAAAAARRGNFDAAFTEVTGLAPEIFARDFTAAMRLRYGWLVTLTRWPTLFVVMGLVLAAGAVRKIVISRRRLAAMDDDVPL